MLRHLKKYWIWYLTGLVVAWSVGGLLLSPFGETRDKVFERGPWVGIGVAISEALFIIGLLMMAVAIGIGIKNPFKLRSQISELLRKAVNTPLFWAGFILNAVGAIGDAVVLAVGVGLTLPLQSWGLIILPSLDFIATVGVRAAVFKWAKRTANVSGDAGSM